ncbi:MAG: FHA domain-containing protein [Nannocystis sp.]|nr:FHA domain-containing protein [Nannocystis sp.]
MSLLTAHHVVGRSRSCHTRVASAETSAEHAVLRWRRGAWILQDLHSRNGTYVDGRLLAEGQQIGLSPGARLGFGSLDQFLLVDAGPPEPHAVELRSPGSTVEMRDGALRLPAPGRAEIRVYREDNAWWVEQGERRRQVLNKEVMATLASSWLLHLPEPELSTLDSEGGSPVLEARGRARIVRQEAQRRFAALSRQEARVCRFVSEGQLNKQIAGEMGIAEATVKLYRANALKKLGVTSVPDLVRLLAHVDPSIE